MYLPWKLPTLIYSLFYVTLQSIDFDLKDLANIFDFPGIDALIRGSILDSIRGIMVTPEKYIVKMAEEADIFQLKYPMPKVQRYK